MELNQYDLALNDFNQALKLNPKAIHVLLERAKLYNTQNQLDLALKDYNQVIGLDARNAKAYLERGQLYEKLNQKDILFSRN